MKKCSMYRKVFLGVSCLIALFSPIASADAEAACYQSDITGTWNAYVVDPWNAEFTRCTMTFNSSGYVTSGTCVDDKGVSHAVKTSSKLTVNSSCVVTGYAYLLYSGSWYKTTITHATLGKDKSYLQGFCKDSDGDMQMLNVIKK